MVWSTARFRSGLLRLRQLKEKRNQCSHKVIHSSTAERVLAGFTLRLALPNLMPAVCETLFRTDIFTESDGAQRYFHRTASTTGITPSGRRIYAASL